MRLVVAMVLASLAASLQPNQTTPAHNRALGIVNTGFVNTLMPQPSHLSAQEGRLILSSSLVVIADHYTDARLDAAIMRSLGRIKTQTGISISASPSAAASGALTVSVDGPGQAIQSVDEDESYSLDVSPSGVRLHAATVAGAMHGLETLQQLVQADATGYFLPAVSVQDTPRFRWRRLMIDCGPPFIAVGVF